VLLSFASAIVAGVAYFITVTTRAGQLMGELILGGRPASADDVATAERYLENVSRSSLVLGTVVVIAIASAQRKPRLALIATVTIVGANVSAQLLKYLVLDRSDLLDGLFYPLPNSFPSGHATAAASIAVALILALPPLLRAPVVLLAAAAVALLGVSTLVAGWHRMADAIGGVYLATAWGAGLAAALVWRTGADRVGHRTAAAGRFTATLTMLIGLGLTSVAAIGYALILADPLDVLDYLASRGGSPAAFAIGVLLTVGSSLLALGALGFVLRDVKLDPVGEAPAKPPSEDLDAAGGSLGDDGSP
jgi:membrane-associated phospholipid phosphatase